MTKEAQATKKAEIAPALYKKAELIRNAETALGVSRIIAAGALHDVDEISLEEAKKRVNTLKKKKVVNKLHG